jgi:hypothetical protein
MFCLILHSLKFLSGLCCHHFVECVSRRRADVTCARVRGSRRQVFCFSLARDDLALDTSCSCVSMVAVGRCGNGQVEVSDFACCSVCSPDSSCAQVVVVEHEERASAAEKFKSSPYVVILLPWRAVFETCIRVRWTYFGGVPCPETKKIELPPLCVAATALFSPAAHI